jgi:hypothetical protein
MRITALQSAMMMASEVSGSNKAGILPLAEMPRAA